MNSNESSFSRPVEQRLRLNEFKELYKRLKRGNPIIDHLLLAALYWLEERFIDLKVESTVDNAIKEVVLPPMPDCVTPVYRETPLETSIARSEQATSLSEMRLTAPWYVSLDDTVEGR